MTFAIGLLIGSALGIFAGLKLAWLLRNDCAESPPSTPANLPVVRQTSRTPWPYRS